MNSLVHFYRWYIRFKLFFISLQGASFYNLWEDAVRGDKMVEWNIAVNFD
jgi:hypothetical protein